MKPFGILLVGCWLALSVTASPAQETPRRKEDKKPAQADIIAGKRFLTRNVGCATPRTARKPGSAQG